MLELKRTVNDPAKIDTDASRALSLPFDHKDLVNLPILKDDSGTGTGIKNKSTKERLKINSEQMISLDEKNEFMSEGES